MRQSCSNAAALCSDDSLPASSTTLQCVAWKHPDLSVGPSFVSSLPFMNHAPGLMFHFPNIQPREQGTLTPISAKSKVLIESCQAEPGKLVCAKFEYICL